MTGASWTRPRERTPRARLQEPDILLARDLRHIIPHPDKGAWSETRRTTVSKRKQGKKQNGHTATSGKNGSGVAARRMGLNALEGATMLGAGQLALAFAKRNPLALAGIAAAGAGIGIALWLFGDRKMVTDAMRSIGQLASKSGLMPKGIAQPSQGAA
jgi:hypothetical protein